MKTKNIKTTVMPPNSFGCGMVGASLRIVTLIQPFIQRIDYGNTTKSIGCALRPHNFTIFDYVNGQCLAGIVTLFMVTLTDKKIKRAVEQVINKGKTTEMVAAIYGVSRRRIQQLAKYYRETGAYA